MNASSDWALWSDTGVTWTWEKESCTSTITRCHCRSPVHLPPHSEVIIPAVTVDVPPSTSWGLIESRHPTNGVLVGKTLVDLGRAGVPVRVMNLSGHSQRIKRGQELANCEPISSVVSGSPSDLDSCNSGGLCLPEHMRPLYERCASELQPHQQQEVIQLLCQNADVFSRGPEDLGRTDVVKHHLETSNASPIRQLPRRLPVVKREEARNAVEQMEQQGLIEPSTSPWASPVVLVKKRDWDQHIPMLLMAYRSAEHDSTKCSPAKLMMGRDLRLPVDLLYGRPEEEHHSSVYADALQERLERVHTFARAHLQMSSNRMKRYYDTRTNQTRFDRSDAVWLHNPQRRKGASPKLQRFWEGPYTVLKRINDAVYRIQLGPRTRPKVVHHN